MRIQPVFNRYNALNKTKQQQTQFERKSNTNMHHKYTGIASADLAYVSMLNKHIAKDLKTMGLI
ncbi:hypothetical protein IJ670_08350 [bacterium]|nr:hypothetical protein [bacterium]